MGNSQLVKNLIQHLKGEDGRLFDALNFLLLEISSNNSRIETLEDSSNSIGPVSRLNSNYSIASSTTYANIGLEVSLESFKTYVFEIVLYYTANAGGGTKLQLAGNVTLDALLFQNYGFDNSGGTTFGFAKRTTLTTFGAQTGSTEGTYLITGSMKTINGGNLRVQFAQNVSNVNASSILAGSYMNFRGV